jgi:hypothetical protein
MTVRGAIGLGTTLIGWAAWAMASAAPVPAFADGADVTGVKSVAGPAHAAESGAVDTTATVGPLAIGAIVRDASGVTLGHITRLTTDKSNVPIAEIRMGVDVYAIPVAALFTNHGRVISTVSADELKQGGHNPPS